MAVMQFEFNYVTPTPSTNEAGDPITLMIPTQFTLGANISEDVVKGIRFGLRKVTSITNVTVERVSSSKEAITADPPA